MVALFRRTPPCSSLACCAKRSLSLYFSRRFVSSNPRRGPEEEWPGGHRTSMHVYENTPSILAHELPGIVSEQRDISTEACVAPEDAGLGLTKAGKPRKRRTKSHLPPETTAIEPDSTPISNEAPPPPAKTRGRKPKSILEPAEEVDPPTTPLAVEVLSNLARYPHCILLTRVGQFYESYFDQAAEVARLLNIKLTKKSWGGQRILMCGFPLMHLNKYLKMLVQEHHRFVAMCEEFPRDPSLGAKGGFDRRVVRIVTPGTLIDEPFLNPYENNYLLSVVPAFPPSDLASDASPPPLNVGLAWIDVSTGEFYTKSTSLSGLRDELVRISPKEVILTQTPYGGEMDLVHKAILEEGYLVSYFDTSSIRPHTVAPPATAPQTSPDDLTSEAEGAEAMLPATLADEESKAVELLTAFMHANLMEHMPSLSSPTKEASSGRMQIDAHTVKALEIRESIREGGTTGSLLSVVKRTVTSSGTRLLARWLCSPSTSVTEINARQSLVAFFHARPFLRQDLVQILRDAEDATRIVQKFLLGRGSFYDLSAICATIDIWSSIKERILVEQKVEQSDGPNGDSEWTSIQALIHRLADLGGLASRIRLALAQREATALGSEENAEEPPHESLPPAQSKNPLGLTEWTIKPEFSRELTRLHTTLQSLLAQREQLERRLQIEYNAPSLTLRASPGQGMYVHIARKKEASKLRADKDFVPLSESGSTCTFFNGEWAKLAAGISEATSAISIAEKEAFDCLRSEVVAHSNDIRRNARIIDELDVTLAFADLAVEMRFVRPIVTDSSSYHVVNGRHPTVELGLLTSGRGFTPNTVTFTPDSQLHIITGPNMAGKSTLLRQTALIAILAQTGSFVPAERAEIGIVDRVFSRIGAKDDLFRDRSTFMVEMLEAGDILRRATPRSLVIMDEVGRGTTVEDGLAIAFATVHHLLSVNGCRAMFATHFHELADMLGYNPETHKGLGPFSNIAFYCTDVDEIEDGLFSYSHRLRPGVNRDSHGLKVARLAGMPDVAVDVARSALAWLKERSAQRIGRRAELHALGQVLVSDRP
ncbi:muts domain V-domain-containing protein [Trametes polyzona]|nr:muts domain V-domain-containing protein [Trametes polyzona]